MERVGRSSAGRSEDMDGVRETERSSYLPGLWPGWAGPQGEEG